MDKMRVCACLAVIFVHACAPYIAGFGQMPFFDWSAAHIIDSLLRWSVPVFVMLSGALNLRDKNENYADYWKKRFSRLIPITIFWSLVYLAHQGVNTSTAIRLLLNGYPYYHLYFLFLIGGLYLFTPFMVRGLLALSEKGQAVCISLIMLITMVDWVVANWLTDGNVKFNAFTLFTHYLGYYLIGAYLLKKPWRNRLALPVFIAAAVITIFATGFFMYIGGSGNSYALYFYTYFSITVVPMSIAVFCLLLNGKSRSMPGMWHALSGLTLGVYLIHPLILEYCQRILARLDVQFDTLISHIFVTVGVTFLLSLAIVYTLSKIPLLRRIVV